MTIIVYAHTAIWADTLGIENVGHVDIVNHAPKISRSPCNRFAYGTTGTVLSGNMKIRVLELLTKHLTLYYTMKEAPMLPHEVYDANMAILGETILITKKDLWVISARAGMAMHTDLGSCASVGSGSDYFTAAMLMGKTVKQAMQSTMDTCYTCGGTIDRISQRSLKPFKIVGAR